MKKLSRTQNYSELITNLVSFIEQGRKAVVRYVNTILVATYWLIGRRIIEYEQKGEKRAKIIAQSTMKEVRQRMGLS